MMVHASAPVGPLERAIIGREALAKLDEVMALLASIRDIAERQIVETTNDRGDDERR